MSQATILTPARIRHLLRVTEATSRHPERDCLILLLTLTCGLRVSELAQIEIQDILFVSGALRTEVSLRAKITKGCRQRCIYLTNKKTVDALERYLALRIRLGLGTELTKDRYRGLSPATCLILTHKGSKFYLNTKRRTNFDGETIHYLACDSLQAHITKLYKNAGIKGGSSHSGLFASDSNIINSPIYSLYLTIFLFFVINYSDLLVNIYHNMVKFSFLFLENYFKLMRQAKRVRILLINMGHVLAVVSGAGA